VQAMKERAKNKLRLKDSEIEAIVFHFDRRRCGGLHFACNALLGWAAPDQTASEYGTIRGRS